MLIVKGFDLFSQGVGEGKVVTAFGQVDAGALSIFAFVSLLNASFFASAQKSRCSVWCWRAGLEAN